MKKVVALIIGTSGLCALCGIILTLCALNFNAPLRNKMLKYYQDDSHYVTISGIIKKIDYNQETDQLKLGIEIITKEHSFSNDVEFGYAGFVIVNYSLFDFELAVGDNVDFTSANARLYNGHRYPILSVKKEENLYLSFQEGKENYLNWIQTTFD